MERGDDVVIARTGTPVVKLVRVEAKKPRMLGAWKGKIWMSDDFDAPMSEEELALWEGTGKENDSW